MGWKINKEFISEKLEGKTTVFNGESSTLYTLNETGTLIFEKLKKGWNRNRISAYVSEKYDVPLAQAKKDVGEFLRNLLKNHLVSSSAPKK